MIKNIKFTNKGGYIPTQGYNTDSGWDLYVNEDANIMPGQFMDIHTGICIHMDEGIWAMITGRSSTGRKHGLRVDTGIIDNGYTGELFVGMWNISDKPIKISKGMRLAQLIFFNRVDTKWELTEKLATTERGADGFGSTGVGNMEFPLNKPMTLKFRNRFIMYKKESDNGIVIPRVGNEDISFGDILMLGTTTCYASHIQLEDYDIHIEIKRLGDYDE